MIKKLFFTLFIFLCLNSKSICNEFLWKLNVSKEENRNIEKENRKLRKDYDNLKKKLAKLSE